MLHPKTNYNDRIFRICAAVTGAFLISEFGSTVSFFERILTWEFYIEYGSTLVISAIVIGWVYRITVWLDQRFNWIKHPVQRLFLQLLLGLGVPAIMVFCLASLYFSFYDVNILETDYLLFAFPLVQVYILLFNVYYFAFYLYLNWKQAQLL